MNQKQYDQQQIRESNIYQYRIYNRESLQNISKENKRSEANRIVNRFIEQLILESSFGKTSYFFELSKYEPPSTVVIQKNMIRSEINPRNQCTSPIDELIPYFQERFPDCKITYQEIWFDTTPTTKELKKGIVIDWS